MNCYDVSSKFLLISKKYIKLLYSTNKREYTKLYRNKRRIMMDDEILTIEQAATYLKVCDKTVRRLIRNKKLKASKVGRSWRIRKQDIGEFLHETQNRLED